MYCIYIYLLYVYIYIYTVCIYMRLPRCAKFQSLRRKTPLPHPSSPPKVQRIPQLPQVSVVFRIFQSEGNLLDGPHCSGRTSLLCTRRDRVRRFFWLRMQSHNLDMIRVSWSSILESSEGLIVVKPTPSNTRTWTWCFQEIVISIGFPLEIEVNGS